jgi:hypothetical protein
LNREIHSALIEKELCPGWLMVQEAPWAMSGDEREHPSTASVGRRF